MKRVKKKNLPDTQVVLNYFKSHWKRSLLILLGFGIALFVYSRLTAEPQGITTVGVYKGTLMESFSANGKVRAEKMADLKFNAPAKVSWISVKEGDEVGARRGIAGLDARSLNATYQNALNDLRNYEANVAMVLDSVQGHANDETFAQRAARTEAEVAKDNAFNNTLATANALNNSMLITPFAGTVVDTNGIVAGVNLSGADLESKYIRIVDLKSLYFEANVDEVDYSKLKAGQEALIYVDAFPDDECKGVVTRIGKDGNETIGGVVTIPVEISLVNCTLDLAVNLNGEANFITNKADNVLIIPKKYLVNRDRNNFVWKQTGSNTKDRELVPVTTGLESLTDVEIKEGISEGDIIIFIP